MIKSNQTETDGKIRERRDWGHMWRNVEAIFLLISK